MKLSNLPFKLESETVRAWYRWTGARPSSLPYLSGDGFRDMTGYRFDGPSPPSFVPESVAPGGLVYCEAWQLDHFLTEIAPRIPGRFSVLAHNGDPNFTAGRLGLLPPNLDRLYTTNALVEDPRVVPVPIGLENARLHYHGVVGDFERLRRHPRTKVPRILVGFTVGTNSAVRGPALEALDRLETCDFPAPRNSRAYRRVASGYQFIVSPPGNGEDCHRTWEALYLSAVPIVLRSILAERFVSLGLPLWIVDSYDELLAYTEGALDARYQELKPGFASPALWMDFWRALIEETP